MSTTTSPLSDDIGLGFIIEFRGEGLRAWGLGVRVYGLRFGA